MRRISYRDIKALVWLDSRVCTPSSSTHPTTVPGARELSPFLRWLYKGRSLLSTKAPGVWLCPRCHRTLSVKRGKRRTAVEQCGSIPSRGRRLVCSPRPRADLCYGSLDHHALGQTDPCRNQASILKATRWRIV